MEFRGQAEFNGISFTDKDIVNIDDWYGTGCDKYKAWLLHDHGFTIAIAFGECEQDALDAIADSGKLDRFSDDDSDAEHLTFLGNKSNGYNIDSLTIVELPKPSPSFVASFKESRPV